MCLSYMAEEIAVADYCNQLVHYFYNLVVADYLDTAGYYNIQSCYNNCYYSNSSDCNLDFVQGYLGDTDFDNLKMVAVAVAVVVVDNNYLKNLDYILG